MAKGKAKSSLEWEQYRAAQIPAPGQYYVDDTLDSIPGGALNKGKAKTAVEWDCYRASQQPGPDYDLEKTWRYIDGTNGRAGFSMKSRSGPAVLPAPYEKFAAPNSQEIRGDPHPSHQQALTPWREDDWKQRKHEAAQALNRSRGLDSTSRGEDSGSDAPLKDDYTASLTPWRDQSLQNSSTRPASRGGSGSPAARPGSAPPAARSRKSGGGSAVGAQGGVEGLAAMEQSEPEMDPEQQRIAAELTAMPWRDKESWEKSNAQVLKMRKQMDEKSQVLNEKMEQRPAFGGVGSNPKIILGSHTQASASTTSRPVPRRPQSAPPPVRRTQSAGSVGGGRGGKGSRGGSRSQSRRQQPKLRTSFEPSTSTPDLLRTSDPKSIGGSVGASFGGQSGQLGQQASRSWRMDLAQRAERLSSFSFGSGSVETSLLVVESAGSASQARKKRQQRVKRSRAVGAMLR